jgi:hypothetical protein
MYMSVYISVSVYLHVTVNIQIQTVLYTCILFFLWCWGVNPGFNVHWQALYHWINIPQPIFTLF